MKSFKQYYQTLCVEQQERDIQVVYINVRSISDLNNGEKCVSNIHDFKCESSNHDPLWDAAENDNLDTYAKNFTNYTDAIEGLKIYLTKAINDHNRLYELHKDGPVSWYKEPFPKTIEEIIRSVQHSIRGLSHEFGVWKLRVFADHDYNIFGIEIDPIEKKQRAISNALSSIKNNTSLNKLFTKNNK